MLQILRKISPVALPLALSLGLCMAAAKAQVRSVALPPEESLQLIELEAGYVVKLLAQEPQVVDPVDVAFDDAGRMWVVEMRDYPFRVAAKPQGRIRVLTDTDGDGVFETSTVFADGLEMPTGLAHWKNGVVVTLAGKLIYLRDLDADLVADDTQIWLEGFAEDNEQLRANHPRLGPDGKWTIASGLRGGEVQLGSTFRTAPAAEPLKIGSRDVRFDPHTASIELITGPAQFGLCLDPFGNRYFCSNRNPAVKVVFEQEDLVGNPLAGLLPSVIDVVPAGETSQVFPLVEAWTTSNLHSGQFTAACGVFVREMMVGQQATGSEIFSCEPTGSLVKRTLAEVHGFAAELRNDPQTAQREWLASRDPWFRPVNVTHAPDGGLAIVDMHRAVIEHPQWVPEELKQRPDERWGDASGRLLWVGSTAQQKLGDVLADLRVRPLGSRPESELVKLVADSTPWIRETAARILVERESADSIAPLMQQAIDGGLPLIGRIASLRLAVGLSAQAPAALDELLADESPALRVAALRILRQTALLDAAQVRSLVKLAEDPEQDVRFEALLCLGNLAANHPQAVELSPELLQAAANSSQPYMLVAAASALRNSPGELLRAWVAAMQAAPDGQLDQHVSSLARGLAAAELKSKEPNKQLWADIVPTVFTAPSAYAQVAALAALSELAARGQSEDLLDDNFWNQISSLATSSQTTPTIRQPAIELLSRSPRDSDSQLLGELVMAAHEPTAKINLLTAWATRGSPNCDAYLIELLVSSSPTMQATVLQLISQRPERIDKLVQEVAHGRLTAKQIGATALKNLVTRAKGDARTQLQQQLDQLVNSNRAKVLQQYQACLNLSGDPLRGKQVFRTQCATCHRIAEVGVQVGPDISDSRTQQPLQLLTSILDPNLAIDNNYFRYVVLTKDEEIIEGMVAEETADAIVIRGQEDKRTVIARDEIAQLKATGVSLMPEGLEAQIDQQAMADLIAYIKGWRYLDGAIPGK